MGLSDEPDLGSSNDVLARLRLRARLQENESEHRPGVHARPRLRLGGNRLAIGGVAAVTALAAAALLLPSLLAASGTEPDPAAGATGLVWESPPASLDGSAPDDELVVVYVTGAVATPGVFELEIGARLVDALELAGGALEGADLASLNLAAQLIDGERIYVPWPGETPPPVIGPDRSGGAGSSSSGGSEGALGSDSGKVNVNQASAEALTALPGIGPVLAQRIVDFRDANGPFAELNDLSEVTGIGSKILAGLSESVEF
ncbi:MAG: ComEA family DNA-binding protein [Bifidobacteriaceae bacterium]|jgi:competence protein ComEA|nr:ComEA family DNA-binding protein [Bifidobacteriaceae bacterium]